MSVISYRKIVPLLGLILLICGTQGIAQEATTQYSYWFGSHYSGFGDYIPKVAEYDRGVDGIMPEFNLNFLHSNGQNNIYYRGFYYDPKRMNFLLKGNLGNQFNGSIEYKSFYRQKQLDLMEYAEFREASNSEGTAPGGKILTHDIQNPNEDLGYKRQELKTNVELQISKNVKLVGNHRSIMEDGKTQHIQISHCATCHLTSRPLDFKQNSHTFSGGLEVDLGKALLTYEASYRAFKSDVEPYSAVYDIARHPVNGGAGSEFASRLNFSGQSEIFSQSPETEKLSHQFKLKTDVGKGRLLAQFVNMNAENKANPNDGNVVVTGDLNYSGNYANLKFSYPIMPKSKLITTGYYGRFKNDPVDVNLPSWRPQAGDAAVDLDWTRYSLLTRTELRGNAEFLYQPTSKYRLSLLAGFSSRERDDYPYFGANDKTNKLSLQAAVRYRPTSKITGNFRYRLESIDNPFAPYNHMFEHYAQSGTYQLLPKPGTPAVYYYQRDDVRYGDITNQATLVHNAKFKIALKPNAKMSLNAGLNLRLGSNSDEPELDMQQKMLQPNLTINFYPNDKFSLFGNYSLTMQEQNFLAAVTMMDG